MGFMILMKVMGLKFIINIMILLLFNWDYLVSKIIK